MGCIFDGGNKISQLSKVENGEDLEGVGGGGESHLCSQLLLLEIQREGEAGRRELERKTEGGGRAGVIERSTTK